MWGARWAVQMKLMCWDVGGKQISSCFECCCFVCFSFFFHYFGGGVVCAFILWSLFPHICSFTAFIALCLTELLSQMHKPAEYQNSFLLSAKGQVQGFITLAVCLFLWYHTGVVDMSMSRCPAPCISLLLSSRREEEECIFLMVNKRSEQ